MQRPAARQEEDDGYDSSEERGEEQQGEADRPNDRASAGLGEVLYGVYPVLNALKAKR